jgi:branched-chain amino acid transport system substrate-binding protein
MRKSYWIALGLILVLALGMFAAACGEEEETTTTAAPASTETTAPASTETTAPAESTTTSAASTEPYEIGFIMSLTGVSAAPAASIIEAANEEVAYINANGGINGRQVVLITEDDKSDMTAGMAAVTKLVEQGVDLLIGPFPQWMSAPAREITEAAGMPHIAPGPPTLDELAGDSTVFKSSIMCSTGADGTADAWAKLVVAEGYKNVLGIGDQIPVHQEGLKVLADGMAESAGFAITVMPDAWALDEADVTPIANKIAEEVKKVNPDALIVASNPIHVPAMTKALRGLGVNLPIIGSGAGSHPAIFMQGPEAVEGNLSIGPGVVDPTALPDGYPAKEELVAFIGRYVAEYPESFPSLFSGFGYDMINLAAAALAGGGDDPAAIASALRSIQWDGAQGSFKYTPEDSYGIHGGFCEWKVEGGRFVFVRTLN